MGFLSRVNVRCNPDDGDQDRFGHAVMFPFMEDLIAQGWRVLGSGDGVSFENQGQTAGATGVGSGGGYHVIDHATGLPVTSSWPVGNLVNASVSNSGASWVRFATPSDADHYMELLIQKQWSSNPAKCLGWVTEICKGSQRFNTGADEWTRPFVNTGTAIHLGTRDEGAGQTPSTRSDEHTFWGPSSGGGGSTNNNRAYWHIGDKEEDYDFLFWTSRGPDITSTPTGEVFSTFGRLRTVFNIQRTVEAGGPSDDPDPYVIIAGFETGGGATNNNFANANFIRSDDGSPERLEDRLPTISSPIFAQMIASFGLDDPAAQSKNRDGHYGVAFWLWKDRGDAAWENMERYPITDHYTEITLLAVGRMNLNRRFRAFKGFVKNNKLLRLSSVNTEKPVTRVNAPTTLNPSPPEPEDYRLLWGRFSVYWGTPEAVKALDRP